MAATVARQRLLLGDSTGALAEQTADTWVICTPGGSMLHEGSAPPPRNTPWVDRLLLWLDTQPRRPLVAGVVHPQHSCLASPRYKDRADALAELPRGATDMLPSLTNMAVLRELWSKDRVHLTAEGLDHVVHSYFRELEDRHAFASGITLWVLIADGWNVDAEHLGMGSPYYRARHALHCATSTTEMRWAVEPPCQSLA